MTLAIKDGRKVTSGLDVYKEMIKKNKLENHPSDKSFLAEPGFQLDLLEANLIHKTCLPL